MKIGFYIKSINNILDKRANEMLNSIGITKSQLDILLYIYYRARVRAYACVYVCARE